MPDSQISEEQRDEALWLLAFDTYQRTGKMGDVLDAVRPLIESEVRERLASALEQEASDRSYDSDEMVTETLLDAAKLVRGVS